MFRLNGAFTYRSFCPQNGAEGADPLRLVPWTPIGTLDVTSDEAGRITGELEFPLGMKIAIAGTHTKGHLGLPLPTPDGVELTGEGHGATYRARGFFVNEDCLTGTVSVVNGDLLRMPDGVSGPFVMLRM